MSRKSDLEIGSLATALIDRFKNLTGTHPTHLLTAAGTTRLGKIEFVHNPAWAIGNARSFQFMEESLLIRIRQKRYSSAGIIDSRITGSESRVRIHIEHQSRYAQVIQIPFRTKRPRSITLGKPVRKETSVRWFVNSYDQRPFSRKLRNSL